MAELKRISEFGTKKESGTGPYGDLPVYSLGKTEALLGIDFKVADYSEMEGQNGTYLHILVAPMDGKRGPGNETGNFVIQTGAVAIVDKLLEAGTDAMPVIGEFVKGKVGASGRTWYDIQ